MSTFYFYLSNFIEEYTKKIIELVLLQFYSSILSQCYYSRAVLDFTTVSCLVCLTHVVLFICVINVII